jgi:polyisoprenoid-binding protein YceI
MRRSVSRPVVMIIALVMLGIGALIGVLGYIYFVGGSGEASRGVQAATLEPGAEGSSGQTFTIVPEESRVLFLLDEDLMGRRNTVIGETNQVTGNILVNFEQPSASMVGPIEINLRTLTTDNEFRNRALRTQILETNLDEFEFTTFRPTAISGMPDSVQVGDTFRFTLVGDLPLRTVTQSLEWEVEVTIVSESRITGRARTTITREQYGLTIPTVQTVANVEEEVDLAIEFVAVAESTEQ